MRFLKNYLRATPENKQSSAAIAFLAGIDQIDESCPTIAKSIVQQLIDERDYLKLIASENFSSYAVQLAMGNWLTDKYAEGFPHHRFYAGCQNVDAIETDAEESLKKLFGAEEAYVQPHSGIDANLVALWAFLFHRFQTPAPEKFGKKRIEDLTPEEHEELRQEMINQKMMGMALDAGGHLTHGYPRNIFSKMIRSVPYTVDRKSEQIDYAALAKQVKQEKPTILLAGFSAYPRRLNFATLREIADSVGAALFVDMAHFAGLVAGKVFVGEENPIPYADFVTSTTHKTLRGPRGGIVLAKKEYGEVLRRGCPVVLGGPLPHVMAAKAVAFREALQPSFQTYAAGIVENSRALAETLLKEGCRLITGGTDNHMVILDVTPFGLTGLQAEKALRQAHITVNRNMIPFDKQGAWNTSGIRIGTPAVTTLGMRPAEMKKIGKAMVQILRHSEIVSGTDGYKGLVIPKIDPSILQNVKGMIFDLLQEFPIYPEIVFHSPQEKPAQNPSPSFSTRTIE